MKIFIAVFIAVFLVATVAFSILNTSTESKPLPEARAATPASAADCPSSLTPWQWHTLKTMQASGNLKIDLSITGHLPTSTEQIAITNKLMTSLEDMPSRTTSKNNLYLACWRFLTGHIDFNELQQCGRVVDTPASALVMVHAIYGDRDNP